MTVKLCNGVQYNTSSLIFSILTVTFICIEDKLNTEIRSFVEGSIHVVKLIPSMWCHAALSVFRFKHNSLWLLKANILENNILIWDKDKTRNLSPKILISNVYCSLKLTNLAILWPEFYGIDAKQWDQDLSVSICSFLYYALRYLQIYLYGLILCKLQNKLTFYMLIFVIMKKHKLFGKCNLTIPYHIAKLHPLNFPPRIDRRGAYKK